MKLHVSLPKTGSERRSRPALCSPKAAAQRDTNALRASEAQHVLGLLAMQSGDIQAASRLFVHAIQLGGPLAEYCVNLGLALRRQGNDQAAAACFRQAIDREPGCAAAHFYLACLFRDHKETNEAIAAFEQAVRCKSDFAEAYFELGNLQHQMSRLEEAAASYRQAIAANRSHARAYFNLGVTLTRLEQWQAAIAAYQQAVQVKPDYAEGYNNLANLLHAHGHLAIAIDFYEKALAASPDYVEAHYNRALALQDFDRPADAVRAYHEVICRQPDHAEAYNNLGNALLALGRPHDALGAYRETLRREPEHAEGHWNLGLAHLLLGNFEAGWEGYEWRFRKIAPRKLPQARWDGGQLDGRRILLHAEQGLGDTLQFVRYAPMVRSRGGSVILECQPPLVDLLRQSNCADRVIGQGQPLPEFDCHVPLLSLPYIFQTRLDTIPAANSYLVPEPEPVEEWRNHLATWSGALRVGLVWSGNPQQKVNRHREVPIGEFEMLSDIPGVEFFCVQQGPQAAEAAAAPAGLRLHELPRTLRDFSDTAGLLANLDLVITVDTSIAHLAGALGRPVWTLLCFAADWRWLLDREDSPWYSSMRLFRQSEPQRWKPVLERVRAELMKARDAGSYPR